MIVVNNMNKLMILKIFKTMKKRKKAVLILLKNLRVNILKKTIEYEYYLYFDNFFFFNIVRLYL
jgi:hypothetical protein